jgi:hypothetical protein
MTNRINTKFIIIGILIIIVLPVRLVYSSAGTSDSDVNEVSREGEKTFGKHRIILDTCVKPWNVNDTSVVKDCVAYLQNFNKHMNQLFNESRNEIVHILID